MKDTMLRHTSLKLLRKLWPWHSQTLLRLFGQSLGQKVQERIANPIGEQQTKGIALCSMQRAILVVDDAH